MELAKFNTSGPGAEETSLDQGLEKMEYYETELGKLIQRQKELNTSQKLFDLKIQQFKEIGEIKKEL